MDSQYDDLRPPATLSPVERQTLVLLHKVLEHLDSAEADYHARMVEVLTEGFTLEYENAFSPYAELPKDDCKLVFDILDMFSAMKASLAKLEEAERERLIADYRYMLTFQGFDGNDAREGKMASYVTYLQSTDRWTDLRDDVQAADGGNSHTLMLGQYEAMLSVFQPIWQQVVRDHRRGYRLDVEQLQQVAQSRA